MPTPTDDQLLWYAMSAPYGRERRAADVLTATRVEHFIPWRRVDTLVRGRRVEREEPAVRNLVFVRATRRHLLALKADGRINTLLQFKTRRLIEAPGRTEPITVPDKMMADFIRVYTATRPDVLTLLTPDDVSRLRPEAHVRIVGGPFDGCEGWYQRVRGSRERRFVVRLDMFMGCASPLIDCDIVKIDA